LVKLKNWLKRYQKEISNAKLIHICKQNWPRLEGHRARIYSYRFSKSNVKNIIQGIQCSMFWCHLYYLCLLLLWMFCKSEKKNYITEQILISKNLLWRQYASYVFMHLPTKCCQQINWNFANLYHKVQNTLINCC